MNDGDGYVRAGEYRIPKEPLRFPDPDPLAGAQVVHLQPDDIVVVRLPHPISPEQATIVRDAFPGRRVVCLAHDVDLGVSRSVFGGDR